MVFTHNLSMQPWNSLLTTKLKPLITSFHGIIENKLQLDIDEQETKGWLKMTMLLGSLNLAQTQRCFMSFMNNQVKWVIIICTTYNIGIVQDDICVNTGWNSLIIVKSHFCSFLDSFGWVKNKFEVISMTATPHTIHIKQFEIYLWQLMLYVIMVNVIGLFRIWISLAKFVLPMTKGIDMYMAWW